MTQPNKSIDRSVDKDRPVDPMTAADGVRLYAMIEQIKKELIEEIKELEERIISLQGQTSRIEASSSENRVGRLELELKEAEVDLQNAERNRRALEEKLIIKKEAVSHSTDTHEKIKTISAYAELEQKRRESDEAFRVDLKRSAIKAVVGALAVSGAFGVVAFIWWLFQLFLNR